MSEWLAVVGGAVLREWPVATLLLCWDERAVSLFGWREGVSNGIQ